VSTDVNNVRNNGAHLVEPIPAEGAPEKAEDAQDQLF
jgi:hypothetical protein